MWLPVASSVCTMIGAGPVSIVETAVRVRARSCGGAPSASGVASMRYWICVAGATIARSPKGAAASRACVSGWRWTHSPTPFARRGCARRGRGCCRSGRRHPGSIPGHRTGSRRRAGRRGRGDRPPEARPASRRSAEREAKRGWAAAIGGAGGGERSGEAAGPSQQRAAREVTSGWHARGHSFDATIGYARHAPRPSWR